MKKFVASYSGGKDSVLAVHRAVQLGYEAVGLIITCRKDMPLSWFHGIPLETLQKVSESLGMPVWTIQTDGENYAENFQKALIQAKKAGAEICVFGDIDLEEHREWCKARCDKTGLEASFPLWQEQREALVREFVANGFTANIIVVNTEKMSAGFLGRQLTDELIDELKESGVDTCGENGEYHTFVSDGPIFRQKVEVLFGEPLTGGGYAVLPVISGNI